MRKLDFSAVIANMTICFRTSLGSLGPMFDCEAGNLPFFAIFWTGVGQSAR